MEKTATYATASRAAPHGKFEHGSWLNFTLDVSKILSSSIYFCQMILRETLNN
ncbi:hypothetical protein [Pseudomonas amygdali]|uniref:hypothetical protein n=1 Tax=Pseudomonas amygdali TaxID=47877 RepID=UPI0013DDAB7F|nr:hypothetical protein [Pseudomonas amygdali]